MATPLRAQPEERPASNGRRVDIVRGFVGGVIGGLMMSLVFVAARLGGLTIGFALILGTTLAGFRGTAPWYLGVAIHLLFSGVLGIVYAWIFVHVVHRAGWLPGTAIGLVHAIVAGLVLGAFPPASWGAAHVPAPGWFFANVGPAGAPLEIFVHLLYGAIVGTIYKNAR